jgi:hypothetical protein
VSALTLSDIVEKADAYADHLGSVEGLQGALRIVAQNVRDVIAANYRKALASPSRSETEDPATCHECDGGWNPGSCGHVARPDPRDAVVEAARALVLYGSDQDRRPWVDWDRKFAALQAALDAAPSSDTGPTPSNEEK